VTEHSIQRYKYPLWATLSSIVPSLALFLIGFATLPRGVQAAVSMFTSLIRGGSLSGEDLLSLAGPLVALAFGGVLSTLYTEVIVTNSGMKVRVYIFKWAFIPWKDVLGVTVPPIPGCNDPNLWCFVRVNRLTLFHRLASISYKTGSKPVLIINKYIEGYGELIKRIEEHVEQGKLHQEERR